VSEDLERAISPTRRTFIKRIVVGTAFAAPVVASFRMSGISALFPGAAPTGAVKSNTAPAGFLSCGTFTVSPAGGTKVLSCGKPQQITVIAQPNTFGPVPAVTLVVYGSNLGSGFNGYVPSGYTPKSAAAVEWPGPNAQHPITVNVVDSSVAPGDEAFVSVGGGAWTSTSATVGSGTWSVQFQGDPAFVIATPPAATPPTSTPASGGTSAPAQAVEGDPATTG
jgi:hypothetical protein